MHILQKIQTNWKSGLTVALVAVPLSISLGVAAGATPLMGVITAIWAGLIAALVGGSNFNVVGPTGALSGILANYVLIHGIATLPLLAILAGIFILIIFVLKWEKYIALIPSSAIHGFTLGVACIIGLNQLNFALGLKAVPVHSHFILNVLESLRHVAQADITTTLVFCLGLIFLIVWQKNFSTLPAPVILAALGILGSYSIHLWYPALELQTLQTKFGSLTGVLAQQPTLSVSMLTQDAAIASFTIAIIAILETLISAKIADGMTRTKHSQRREVLGLGLANIASGLFGGIPATAALARTALNVKSGAKHKASAAIHSVIVAAITIAFFPWFQYLPLNIVAAILVYVAIRMVSSEHFAHLYHYDKAAFFISLAVAFITVVIDPMSGILVGAIVSLLFFIHKIAQAGGEVTINRDGQVVGRFHSSDLTSIKDHGDVIVYRFSGELTYINAQAHMQAISQINGTTHTIILSFRNLYYVDIDGLDAIEEIIAALEGKEKVVCLSGMNSIVLSLFQRTQWYQKMQENSRVFDSSAAAIAGLQGRPGACC